jgi:hypothetical protein
MNMKSIVQNVVMMSVRVVKTKSEGEYLYINILDFKDEEEWNQIYYQVKSLLLARKEYTAKQKMNVFLNKKKSDPLEGRNENDLIDRSLLLDD